VLNLRAAIQLYLQQLMPTLLTCVVGKRLCERPEEEDHWALRDYAASLVKKVCERWPDFTQMQTRITRTLIHAFLDVSKPITTHYGAAVALTALGPHVIQTLLLPNIPLYASAPNTRIFFFLRFIEILSALRLRLHADPRVRYVRLLTPELHSEKPIARKEAEKVYNALKVRILCLCASHFHSHLCAQNASFLWLQEALKEQRKLWVRPCCALFAVDLSDISAQDLKKEVEKKAAKAAEEAEGAANGQPPAPAKEEPMQIDLPADPKAAVLRLLDELKGASDPCA
jgi:hypothetical protein